MSPPSKRRRMDGQFSPNDGLLHDFDVNQARKANDLRLKSRFESIFEKYGKDFSSVGDEIDLAKGTIVVDNGHLTEMGDEHDVGRGLWDDFHPEDESEAEEGPLGQNTEPTADNTGDPETVNTFFKEWVIQDDYDATAGNEEQPATVNVDFSTICPENPLPVEGLKRSQELVSTPSSQLIESEGIVCCGDAKGHEDNNIAGESLWDAPPLPTTALSASLEDMTITTTQLIERTPSPDHNRSIWAAPRSRRRRLPHINKRKHPKLTAACKSKLVSNDSDSDDPIQDHTPVSSTSRRPATFDSVTPAKDTMVRMPTEFKDIYIPPQNDPTATIAENYANGVTISEPETMANVTVDTPVATKKKNPETPTHQPIINPDSEPDLAVDTPIADPGPELSSVNGSPSAEITTPRGSSENLTPREVKTLVTLRLAKRKPWREVSLAIPSRSPAQLRQWYYAYCKHISGNLSTSLTWTDSDREALASFNLDTETSWDTVQSKFPTRNLVDIQHEWIKICVGGTIWQSWVDSKTPRKAKKRPFTQDSWLQTPVRPSVTVPSPLRPGTVSSNSSVHLTVEDSPLGPAEGTDNREESPDPLSEAFERAWHSSGLSSVQISTPPRASGSPKKHLLSSGKTRSAVVQRGGI
ncbi:TPA_exp: Myb-like DNA-binding domain protein [Trichophyton benhamiae CBS 112371]|uniref:Myb-like DNA-binding domain protein n=1 Tax=Arthroderma benhamiae (strain ATCC MYA-4681 / CBS 112371) TaxID=663331 RepID=D4AQQ4_ARTBC|nr:Myb-like DNA-binding domain protein [Trichophyton benhamiae CBS 112371]EFE34798.1 Myb-like DNA-binding domain protein [Trichophyton benhamiae CBS 112371]DAA77719.1 TPA_exp: Myb-like DNA-binding domain protein [Trichophyton benhamiae CBS 112371]